MTVSQFQNVVYAIIVPGNYASSWSEPVVVREPLSLCPLSFRSGCWHVSSQRDTFANAWKNDPLKFLFSVGSDGVDRQGDRLRYSGKQDSRLGAEGRFANGRTDNTNRDREAQAASRFQEDFSAIRIRLKTVFKVSASRSLR